MEDESFGLGVLIGFIATLVLGYTLPLLEPSNGWWIASFIGGIVAGYFAKSGTVKGLWPASLPL
jgi:hypothetical protein